MTRVPREKMAKRTIFLGGKGVSVGGVVGWRGGVEGGGFDLGEPFKGQLCFD